MANERRNQEINGYLKNDNVIERFALLKLKNGEKQLEIQNYNLSEEEKELFYETSRYYSDFKKINQMYDIFLEDVANIINYTQKIEKDGREGEEYLVNYYFIHLLSSAKLFITYIENQFKERWSEGSKYFRDWKNKTHEVYDNSFSYRFCYHLRNFTQHKGFAITKMDLNIDGGNPNKKATYDIYIDINAMINSGYKWKKNILKELESLTEDIDVKNLIQGFYDSIVKLYISANEIYLSANNERLKELKKELDKIYDSPDIPHITKVNKKGFKKSSQSYESIELNGKREIDKIYVELSKINLVNLKYVQ
ncbi:hypothetical protein [Salinicoccus luteus]|uniref:hypothetical protein n=1 Tax=Salinicoccus luteus TaxID=367840 RepID=UPI0004E23A3E|nr:hypothetical protein [Salinicoccus luteus]